MKTVRETCNGFLTEMMRVLSVNVGRPRGLVGPRGRTVQSAIVKEPVEGPVIVRKLNFEGDEQADLRVHGGENKAVYVYPSEHYPYWKEYRFPKMDMPWGTFGENLTTRGLFEEAVHVGDQFGVGSAIFEATQPRFPCFRLGMRFKTQEMVKWFLDSERSGIYFKVVKEGRLKAGDAITRTYINKRAETIASIVRAVKES